MLCWVVTGDEGTVLGGGTWRAQVYIGSGGLLSCSTDTSTCCVQFDVNRNKRNDNEIDSIIAGYGRVLWRCQLRADCYNDDVKRIDVAWNNAFRNIFDAYWYQSVKPLQYHDSCLPASIMLPMRKLLFWKKMLCIENVVLCLLAKSCKDSFIALADKFHIRSDDVLNASVFTIRYWFWWFYIFNLIA